MRLNKLLLGALLGLCVLIAGCGDRARPEPTPPPQAPPAVQVLVPVAAPCVVASVPRSVLPSAAGVPNDLFDAVKVALGDRAALMAEIERLRGANSNPCPAPRN